MGEETLGPQRGPDASGRPAFELVLFVAGREPNSAAALRNIRSIAAKYLDKSSSLQVTDVLEDFAQAVMAGVFVTPTLIATGPNGEVRIIGNLNDTCKVLSALQIEEPNVRA